MHQSPFRHLTCRSKASSTRVRQDLSKMEALFGGRRRVIEIKNRAELRPYQIGLPQSSGGRVPIRYSGIFLFKPGDLGLVRLGGVLGSGTL